jgi:predicted GIY-YIG superfamily endonuclease
MKQLKWSGWFDLQTLNFEIIPPKPGVYEIRSAINGKPQPIDRANGIDKSGLLYIGQSHNLKRRIKGFWQHINEGKQRHTAARTYQTYGFEQKFPPEHLQIRWTQLSKEETGHIESLLLDSYANKFLDKPPLNISIKRTKIPFHVYGAYSDR